MNTPSARFGHRRRLYTGAAALMGLLVLAGCGSGPPEVNRKPAPTPVQQSALPGQPIEAWYTIRSHSDEGSFRADFHLIAAGAKRIRVTSRSTAMEPESFVYDGDKVLLYDASYAIPYMLYEAPEEHRDVFGMVQGWLLDPGSDTFAKSCPQPQPITTTRTIADRTAVGYTCHRATGQGGMFTGAEIWLDQATGLLLKQGLLEADKVNATPRVDASTFSTEPPPGVQVDVYAAKHSPGGKQQQAPGFTLQLLDGGTVDLNDLAGKPFVLAFFTSDLYFDPNGEVCARCIPALLAVQQLTQDGTRPRVLAVQTGDEGKPGYPLVPDGVELTVGRDSTGTLQHRYGLSHQVGFAFVGSDGTIDRLYDGPATDQQLRDALAALH
jgi:outer membrane lipoprotein-sorting protein